MEAIVARGAKYAFFDVDSRQGPGSNSRSNALTVRVERDGLVLGLRSASEILKWDSDDDGLPFHGLSELAILRDLAVSGPQPASLIQEGETLLHLERFFIVFQQRFDHDLVAHLRERVMTPTDVRCFSNQVLTAVEWLHARDILHRNIKPSHILIDDRGKCVLSGFESACRTSLRNGGTYKLGVAPIVTPPERLLGETQCDKSADIWAFGLVVATMGGAGKMPFDGQGCQIGLIFCIFQRLGTPCHPHPLTLLPDFSEKCPRWSNKGWDDLVTLLTPDGVALLSCLTELDPTRRLSAANALCHPYFAKVTTDINSIPPTRSMSSASFNEGETATQIYLEMDLRLERKEQMRRLRIAQAIRACLGNHGHADLCHHVWTFLFRPRRCETVLSHCLVPDPELVRAGGFATHPEGARATMIDWLIGASDAMKFESQVVFVCARLIDSFLCTMVQFPMTFLEFRSLVVGALLVAVKIERQDNAGTNGWLAHVTRGDAAIVHRALHYEQQLIHSPGMTSRWGPYHFLCAYANEISLPATYFKFAHFLLDRALLVWDLCRHSASLLAAAACMFAASSGQEHGKFDLCPQPETLAKVFGRSWASVARVAKELEQAASENVFPDLVAAENKHAYTAKLLRKNAEHGSR